MREAGYSDAEAQELRAEVDRYEKVRQEVKLASGDYIDMKMYEPAMRHLLDTYIRAEESEQLLEFDDLTLIQLVVERGEKAIDGLPTGIRQNQGAVAETIENNVRRLIIDETAVNPKYYDRMSELLDALILQRREEAIEYKEYLDRIVELTRRIAKPGDESSYPQSIISPSLQALFDNLVDPAGQIEFDENEPSEASRESMALALDHTIRSVKKADWRGNKFKEREVRNAIKSELGGDDAFIEKIFEIVKAQSDY